MEASKSDKALRKKLHECNNHLAVIWGYIQLLNKRLEVQPEEQEWLDKISDECKNLKLRLQEIANQQSYNQSPAPSESAS